MTPIEKAKEALDFALYSPDDFLFTAKYLREHIENALRELETPICSEITNIVEHLSVCQSRWSDDWQEELSYAIHQYAESYHAKKCAECDDRCLRAHEHCEDVERESN